MGPPPAKIKPGPIAKKEALKPVRVVAKPVIEKKLNCFVMPDKPDKAGLMLVATDKVQGGCYVLGWQPQSTTWLVSEGVQWYEYSGRVLKAQLSFAGIFALCLLIVLALNRVR